jgi:hypothetical protein
MELFVSSQVSRRRRRRRRNNVPSYKAISTNSLPGSICRYSTFMNSTRLTSFKRRHFLVHLCYFLFRYITRSYRRRRRRRLDEEEDDDDEDEEEIMFPLTKP